MPNVACPVATERESLRRVCALATHNASAVLSLWTGRRTALSLAEIRDVPLERVCEELGIGDELLTMVVVGSAGALGAEVVLMFDETAGRDLAAGLLGCKPGSGPEWDELERSALTETGNVLACAYLNAVADAIGRDLVPTAPCFLRDYGASAVQQAILVQAVQSDRVLVCRTGFRQDGERLQWQVLFIPTEAMRKCIEHPLPGAGSP